MLVAKIKNPTTGQYEAPSRFVLPSSVVASVIESYLAEHPITLSDAQASAAISSYLTQHPVQNGYTPVKGTDYFTAADKAELVQSVIAALPSAEGGSF